MRDIDFRHDALDRDRFEPEDEARILEHYQQREREENYLVRIIWCFALKVTIRSVASC